MDLNFSARIRDVISFSKEEAERLGNRFISPEHLMLGILREGEGAAVQIMEHLQVDLSEIRNELEESLKEKEPYKSEQLPLLKSTERVLKLVHLEAKALKSKKINTGHLLWPF